MSEPEITGRELNVLVAEKVLGWTRGPRWGNGNGQWFIDGKEGPTWDTMPRFSKDIRAAIEVEDRIATLDLGAEYADALKDVVTASWKDRDISPGLFGLIHATPRERCLAALKTIEDNSWRYETVSK